MRAEFARFSPRPNSGGTCLYRRIVRPETIGELAPENCSNRSKRTEVPWGNGEITGTWAFSFG
ncbi:hypothetical protein RE6C_03410 [Rhodopirellula europaea 6C]|uniref:Uncharacterized protein n=1 Tax=Rhodopirellula europaea 6C TaxID=1263867 RepID=M2A5X1_9BACT|nr:hypothetical protein RE6C_03410 [Rhodopirellula europaea 6C]